MRTRAGTFLKRVPPTRLETASKTPSRLQYSAAQSSHNTSLTYRLYIHADGHGVVSGRGKAGRGEGEGGVIARSVWPAYSELTFKNNVLNT